MMEVLGGSSSRLLVINSAPQPNDKRMDIWSALKPRPFVADDGSATRANQAAPQDVIDASADDAAPGAGEREGEKKALGRHLSSSDLQDMADFAAELAVKHVIPHLERKVRDLNQQVWAVTRRENVPSVTASQ